MTTRAVTRAFLPAILSAILLACSVAGTPGLAQEAPSFTEAQALAGQARYRELCQICHGSSLANGQFGTPLRGSFFRNNWKDKSVGELLQFIYEKMPPDDTMSLTPEQTAELLAYIFSRNDLVAGSAALSGDSKAMGSFPLPW